MHKVFMIVITLVLAFTLLACSNQDDNGMIPDPGGKFSYDMVLVTLTVSATDAAKISEHVFTPADFPVVRLSEVRVLWEGRPGRRTMLTLILAEPSRDNVLTAIYRLRKSPEIFSANVNGYSGLLPFPPLN